MIHKLIDLLNDGFTSFKILNLCEENDTDYVLVSVDSKLVAVEVCYEREVSFKRISPEKRRHMMLKLSLDSVSTSENNCGASILV